MKILITGGNGQVAFDLVRLASQQNYLFYAPTHTELDVSQSSQVLNLMRAFRPDVVINTAAYTRVDQAEKEPAHALAVNAMGAKHLAIACRDFNAALIHLSTDYVFDGKQLQAYDEFDPARPINTYGMTKWQGEEMVRQHCEKHLVLRVSAVFGVHGINFVKTILQLAAVQKVLHIVNDQRTCPTPSLAIAETLLKLLHCSQWGTYHYCGDEAVTWYDFAKQILQVAQLTRPQVEAIGSEDYPTAAKRPFYSVLNCDRIDKTFSIKRPHWAAGLHHVIQHLSAP